MNRLKVTLLITLTALTTLTTAGCQELGETSTTGVETPADGAPVTRPEGWTEASHSNDAEPDYDIVFPQGRVNSIKITLSPENWAVMQEDMTRLFGGQVEGQRGGLPNFGQMPPDGVMPGPFPGGDNLTLPKLPRDGAVRPDGGFALPEDALRPAGGSLAAENPVWIPATIEFNGLTWTNVGVRYKGNSSLASSWRSGNIKMPLKLDFDEFEDEYPEIDDQRFYGFKQLSLSNGFNDITYLRDALTSDLLQEAGLVAAETAYYEVIMDYGEGEVNLGLYIVVEVIDDTVIDRCFDDDSGNIYEADGRGASLAQGTFNQIKDSFLKENNQDEADWSDIEELYNVLHAGSRTSDPAAWRESLEEVFDVDDFLEWLAISAVMEHWDTYGSMTHNFYLYHDPETGLLTWISWDHNEVLKGSAQREAEMPEGVGVPRGMGGLGGGMRRDVSLDKKDIGQDWPLIRYLLDDPVYGERYRDYVAEAINGVCHPDNIAAKCREMAKLIAPYVATEPDRSGFQTSVDDLIDRAFQRYEAAEEFLAAGE